MADQLSEDDDVEVSVVRGGFLELSVYINGHPAIKTNPLWYPLPGKVTSRTRQLLTAELDKA